MSDILNNTLNLIDDIINKSEVKNKNFYSHILNLMSSLYKNCSLGIFFCENTEYRLRAARKNKKNILSYKINPVMVKKIFKNNSLQEFKTVEDDLFYTNTIVQKLAIKESVFGFCILSTKDEITEEMKNSFCAVVNLISYKIKDYELNEVFKIQLKAMQDAIIEKDNAYEIIKKQHKKLQELDKTKSLFLANISHELRTPLNAIIGFSQALDSQIFGKLNDKQAEYIKDIQISSLHLLGMINEILDISKFEAHAMKFSPSEINPTQSIKEVVNILEPLYKNKNIKIKKSKLL